MQATYYVPYVPKENTPTKKPIGAKGKLVDKYRNIMRLYKSLKDENETTENDTENETNETGKFHILR